MRVDALGSVARALGCRAMAEAWPWVLCSSFPLRWLVMELQITPAWCSPLCPCWL